MLVVAALEEEKEEKDQVDEVVPMTEFRIWRLRFLITLRGTPCTARRSIVFLKCRGEGDRRQTFRSRIREEGGGAKKLTHLTSGVLWVTVLRMTMAMGPAC